jgi:hypothetical protein
MIQSLDGEQMVINFTTSDVQRDPVVYRQVIHALLTNAIGPALGGSRIEQMPEGSPRPAGKSSLMRVSMPGEAERLYVGTQYCPGIGLSLISVWTVAGATDELARERQSQIGCPGEESTTPAEFSALAESACSNGQKQFCGLKNLPEAAG